VFSLLFEFQPPAEQWDLYLANGKDVRPELEQVQGLLENIRYRSLTRDGWMLSLSDWSDEPSVVGWHTRMSDHEAKETARSRILGDYRLRVGEVTSDTRAVEDRKIIERRFDASQAGTNTYVTLIDARQTPQWVRSNTPQEIALHLGFDLNSYGNCISWDVFDAVFNPGEIILVVTWKDFQSANDHAATQMVPDDARVRVLRVVRDYSMSSEVMHDRSGGPGREAVRA
jgi:heme-degrading monooxygenase HmoA